MTSPDSLAAGREAFARLDWTAAFSCLSAADHKTALEPDDIELLAKCAHLLGRKTETSELWARVHQAFLGQGKVHRAVRSAFWLAYDLINSGEAARAAGWLARARRLLGEDAGECVETGYLLFHDAFQAIDAGENAASAETFSRAAALGERFGDPDLVVMCRHGEGQALIRLGDVARGIRLLDEIMVAVIAGEISPMVTGDLYCGVITACQDIFDIRRAREWTAALDQWCNRQPSLVAYRGRCMVRRAEVMQWQGNWTDAMAEANRACGYYAAQPGQPGSGAAYYQLAEAHRLRGELEKAEEAYREAGRRGKTPQPGLALLRLASNQVDAAAAAIRGALAQAPAVRTRSILLPAAIEILLSVGDEEGARSAAVELATIAEKIDSPFLAAAAARAEGALRLASGDASNALPLLRRAVTLWRELAIPYEAARTGVILGNAARSLGDIDTAELELDLARETFRRLGATTELSRIESSVASKDPAGGLTGRELEVLSLVAAGKTNRVIATELSISEKTVARHLSNIFTKLGLSSRAAATAYAYEHHLVHFAPGA